MTPDSFLCTLIILVYFATVYPTIAGSNNERKRESVENSEQEQQVKSNKIEILVDSYRQRIGIRTNLAIPVKILNDFRNSLLEISRKDPNSIKSIVGLLNSDKNEWWIIEPAIDALREIGMLKEAEAALITLLNSAGSKSVRQNAAEGLGDIGSPQAIAFLTEVLLQDKSEDVRRSAADALGNTKDPRAIDSLVESLSKEKDKFMRGNVVASLAKIKDPRIVEPLIAIAEEYTKAKSDWGISIKTDALEALIELKDRRALDLYVSILSDEEYGFADYSGIRMDAAKAILELTDPNATTIREAALKAIEEETYITVTIEYNQFERPILEILKNIEGKEVARKVQGVIVDESSGKSFPADKWICLDKKGNIIKKGRKPVFIERFQVLQKSYYEHMYDGSFRIKTIGKIYPVCRFRFRSKDDALKFEEIRKRIQFVYVW